jgi:hypothetical protein
MQTYVCIVGFQGPAELIGGAWLEPATAITAFERYRADGNGTLVFQDDLPANPDGMARDPFSRVRAFGTGRAGHADEAMKR